MADNVQFDRATSLVAKVFEKKESEDTWLIFETEIKTLIKTVQEIQPHQLVFVFKKKLKNGISTSLQTERTRLCRTTLILIETVSKVLNKDFNQISDIYLPLILKLTSRANRVYVQSSLECLKACISQSGCINFIPNLLDGMKSPSKTTRICSAELLLTTLKTAQSSCIQYIGKKKIIDLIETAIKDGVVDSCEEVRGLSRALFELYSLVFEDHVIEFNRTLTDMAKRYLKIPVMSQKARPAILRKPIAKDAIPMNVIPTKDIPKDAIPREGSVKKILSENREKYGKKEKNNSVGGQRDSAKTLLVSEHSLSGLENINLGRKNLDKPSRVQAVVLENLKEMKANLNSAKRVPRVLKETKPRLQPAQRVLSNDCDEIPETPTGRIMKDDKGFSMPMRVPKNPSEELSRAKKNAEASSEETMQLANENASEETMKLEELAKMQSRTCLDLEANPMPKRAPKNPLEELAKMSSQNSIESTSGNPTTKLKPPIKDKKLIKATKPKPTLSQIEKEISSKDWSKRHEAFKSLPLKLPFDKQTQLILKGLEDAHYRIIESVLQYIITVISDIPINQYDKIIPKIMVPYNPFLKTRPSILQKTQEITKILIETDGIAGCLTHCLIQPGTLKEKIGLLGFIKTLDPKLFQNRVKHLVGKVLSIYELKNEELVRDVLLGLKSLGEEFVQTVSVLSMGERDLVEKLIGSFEELDVDEKTSEMDTPKSTRSIRDSKATIQDPLKVNRVKGLHNTSVPKEPKKDKKEHSSIPISIYHFTTPQNPKRSSLDLTNSKPIDKRLSLNIDNATSSLGALKTNAIKTLKEGVQILEYDLELMKDFKKLEKDVNALKVGNELVDLVRDFKGLEQNFAEIDTRGKVVEMGDRNGNVGFVEEMLVDSKMERNLKNVGIYGQSIPGHESKEGDLYNEKNLEISNESSVVQYPIFTVNEAKENTVIIQVSNTADAIIRPAAEKVVKTPLNEMVESGKAEALNGAVDENGIFDSSAFKSVDSEISIGPTLIAGSVDINNNESKTLAEKTSDGDQLNLIESITNPKPRTVVVLEETESILKFVPETVVIAENDQINSIESGLNEPQTVVITEDFHPIPTESLIENIKLGAIESQLKTDDLQQPKERPVVSKTLFESMEELLVSDTKPMRSKSTEPYKAFLDQNQMKRPKSAFGTVVCFANAAEYSSESSVASKVIFESGGFEESIDRSMKEIDPKETESGLDHPEILGLAAPDLANYIGSSLLDLKHMNGCVKIFEPNSTTSNIIAQSSIAKLKAEVIERPKSAEPFTNENFVNFPSRPKSTEPNSFKSIDTIEEPKLPTKSIISSADSARTEYEPSNFNFEKTLELIKDINNETELKSYLETIIQYLEQNGSNIILPSAYNLLKTLLVLHKHEFLNLETLETITQTIKLFQKNLPERIVSESLQMSLKNDIDQQHSYELLKTVDVEVSDDCIKEVVKGLCSNKSKVKMAAFDLCCHMLGKHDEDFHKRFYKVVKVEAGSRENVIRGMIELRLKQ